MKQIPLTIRRRQHDDTTANISHRLNSGPRLLRILQKRHLVNNDQIRRLTTGRIRSRRQRLNIRVVRKLHLRLRHIHRANTELQPLRQILHRILRLLKQLDRLTLSTRQHQNRPIRMKRRLPQRVNRHKSRKANLTGLQHQRIPARRPRPHSLHLGLKRSELYPTKLGMPDMNILLTKMQKPRKMILRDLRSQRSTPTKLPLVPQVIERILLRFNRHPASRRFDNSSVALSDINRSKSSSLNSDGAVVTLMST